jgi:hypothetical protein
MEESNDNAHHLCCPEQASSNFCEIELMQPAQPTNQDDDCRALLSQSN